MLSEPRIHVESSTPESSTPESSTPAPPPPARTLPPISTPQHLSLNFHIESALAAQTKAKELREKLCIAATEFEKALMSKRRAWLGRCTAGQKFRVYNLLKDAERELDLCTLQVKRVMDNVEESKTHIMEDMPGYDGAVWKLCVMQVECLVGLKDECDRVWLKLWKKWSDMCALEAIVKKKPST